MNCCTLTSFSWHLRCDQQCMWGTDKHTASLNIYANVIRIGIRVWCRWDTCWVENGHFEWQKFCVSVSVPWKLINKDLRDQVRKKKQSSDTSKLKCKTLFNGANNNSLLLAYFVTSHNKKQGTCSWKCSSNARVHEILKKSGTVYMMCSFSGKFASIPNENESLLYARWLRLRDAREHSADLKTKSRVNSQTRSRDREGCMESWRDTTKAPHFN